MPASPPITNPASNRPATNRVDPGREAAGFAVYVHWPFCLSKCPYCDFNSHVRESVDQAAWRTALLRELDATVQEIGPRRVRSLFFGGGTPSLMPAATVAAIVDRVAERWGFEPDAEITLEANPTSVEAGRFADFRAAGVNRLSLGVQALRDADLKFLGREHSAAEAQMAIALARKNFDRLSFDLIYARPEQTEAEWRTELGAAIDLAADHLSLYQLTIEPGTGFYGAVARGAFTPPDADAAAGLYEATQEMCEAVGMPAYEVSNHAAPGAGSRHNLVYWRYGEYAGIGPGAHGRLTLGSRHPGQHGHRATANLNKPERWLAAVTDRGTGRESVEPLTPADRGPEMLMMGMRLSEGVSLARYEALSGGALDSTRLDELVADGLLWRDGDRFGTTAPGRLVLNGVLLRLLS